MAVSKNKTQSNFTMISNNVLRDKELSMKDRGVFCTICSLPDGWNFSVSGLSAIVPDGVDAIRSSIINLEELGYMERTKTRGKDGKYVSEIEIFTERKAMLDLPSRGTRHGKSKSDNPLRVYHDGGTVMGNPAEYNTDNLKKNIKSDDIKSIHQSAENSEIDGQMDIIIYKKLIADNIKLDWLLDVASHHNADEVQMVHEIYDVICDMVCYPRERVEIKSISYPWTTVQSQFLKLRYQHIADILNRIVDAELEIKNMSAYLISTLYMQSLVGTIEAQAKLHDDYLKCLRGKPY